jgi:gas vesicle protein
MSFDLILGIGIGALTGAVAVLALVAPRTKTTVDDKALEVAKKVLELAEQLKK